MELNSYKLEYELILDEAIRIESIHRDEHQLIKDLHHIRFSQLVEHVEENNPKESNF